jgi:hypothetical protein
MNAKIMLNTTRGSMLWKYHDGDQLDTVLEFEIAFPECGRIEQALDIIWRELNIDEPQTLWGQMYRLNRNRSLSMGDVVVLGETAFTPITIGWKRVTLTAGGTR